MRNRSSALRSLFLAGAALMLAGQAQARDVATLKPAIDALLDKTYAHLDALYKDIHAHPELGFQETATAAKLAAEMKALGFTVTEGVGKTGLVAIYKNGPGPVVMVRTELDALPMEEKSGLPYASHATQVWNGKPAPVAHSCGHDIHMASWVGTAQALVAMKDKWRGTLMFIAQPAEEGGGGAKGMIDDGLFTRFPKPTYGFGLHVGPGPYGFVSYRPGVTTSNADSMEILFKGRGGHGSMPSLTIDSVVQAAKFVVDVQTVISREKDPAAFGVVTVGAIQAGSAGNIIPDSALIRGTIRSYEPGVRAKLLDGVRRTANAEAAMAGAPAPQIDLTPGGTAVVNDVALTERTAKVFKAAFGDKANLEPAPSPASEDYSEFILAGVPSVFFNIGGYDPARIAAAKAKGEFLPGNHTPYFAPVPEPTIRTGVAAMTLAVMNVMQP